VATAQGTLVLLKVIDFIFINSVDDTYITNFGHRQKNKFKNEEKMGVFVCSQCVFLLHRRTKHNPEPDTECGLGMHSPEFFFNSGDLHIPTTQVVVLHRLKLDHHSSDGRVLSNGHSSDSSELVSYLHQSGKNSFSGPDTVQNEMIKLLKIRNRRVH